MKFLTVPISIVAALTSVFLFAADADARPLGGKKSVGMKRDSAQQNTATPPSAPAAAPAKSVAPAGTPAMPAAAPSGMSKWLGPLAGLAAGGLLASMFMGGGFGGLKMFDILLFAGLAFGAFMVWRMLAQRKATAAAAAATASAGGNTMQ